MGSNTIEVQMFPSLCRGQFDVFSPHFHVGNGESGEAGWGQPYHS